jgi:hypothetical protein
MSIEEALRRHQDRLLALPGVVGVGIGEHAGRPVLVVFLDRPAGELEATTFPTDLEGFPVELEVVGEVRAL